MLSIIASISVNNGLWMGAHRMVSSYFDIRIENFKLIEIYDPTSHLSYYLGEHVAHKLMVSSLPQYTIQ